MTTAKLSWYHRIALVQLVSLAEAFPAITVPQDLPTNNNQTQQSSSNHSPIMPLRTYLRNPTDFTAVLLIIGGDIIQKALAQLSGPQWGAPVAFSFGWVAYSFSALASVVGDGRLMPEPEFQSFITNCSSGYVRLNGSWVLARLLRDLERDAPKGKGGLCVTFLDALGRGGVAKRDWVWYIGLIVMPAQFAIALIPWILFHNWIIFLLTLSGTALAWSASVLPQWAAEKWLSCRRREATYSLSRGNGHRHVFVIQNRSPEGLNLEDMAASHVHLTPLAEWLSRIYLSLLALLWLVFLICAGTVKIDIWYLLAVGFLGMLQNILVAGATRDPRAHGINLKQREIVEGTSVMKVLQSVERKYPGVGISQLKMFFPGILRPEEEVYWEARRNDLQSRKSGFDASKRSSTI